MTNFIHFITVIFSFFLNLTIHCVIMIIIYHTSDINKGYVDTIEYTMSYCYKKTNDSKTYSKTYHLSLLKKNKEFA